ncbi:MAG: hypothetical protein JWL73_2293 [Actinomycetia bacterium]|nr:hypothetical protein [Actinomycetes bacterium]
MGPVTRRLSRARHAARGERAWGARRRLAWLSVLTVIATVAAVLPTPNAFALGGTTTTITSVSSSTTVVGQAYTVNVNIAYSGSGTPSGTVTVSDGSATCTTSTFNNAPGSNVSANCDITSTSAGTKSITAAYGGGGGFNASSSGATTHTVNKASTTTAVTSSANPSTGGQSVTFTATASATSPGSGTPTGTVQFKDGAANLGSAQSLSSGAATLSTSALTNGSHSITAVYAGDANYTTSTSSALTQSVRDTTTTSITSDTPDPSTVGGNYTVAVAVARGGATGTPSGTVTVSDGTATCTATLAGASGTGTGNCALSSATVGAKTLTATYNGDTAFGTSAGTTAHSVTQGATTTTVVDANDPSFAGSTYAVTATVTRTGANGTPTGTVTVSDGTDSCTTGTLAGSASAPTATCNLTSSTAGTKTVTATYGGDANFTGSSGTTTHTVSPLIAVTMTAADANDPSTLGTSYGVSANVNPASGSQPDGSVTFSDGVGGTCTDGTSGNGAGSSADFSCTINNTTVGALTITATYTPDATHAAATATTTHTVTKANSTTTVTDTPDPSALGANYTATATVTRVGTVGTPTGTVTISDGTNSCTTTSLTGSTSAPSGSCTLTSATAGAKTLTATYAGDANFNGGSGTTAHTVSKANSSVAVTSSVNPSVFGQSTTLTATVTPSAATGTVQFRDGATNIGSAVTVSGGVATLAVSSLSVGTHGTINAVYSGDANYNTSTSPNFSQVVNQSGTTTAITSSTNPSAFGQSTTFTATVAAVSPGAGTPTGTVQFKDGATNLGAAATLSGGVATLAVSTLTSGSHSITAVYSATTNFTTSTSAVLTQTVGGRPTTTSVSCTTPASVGTATPCTFTVTDTGGAGATSPAGTVTPTTNSSGTFSAPTCTLAATTAGVSTCTLNYTPTATGSGTHLIGGSYGGETAHAASTATAFSMTVSAADTTVTLGSSLNPSKFGHAVTFTATVASSGGTPTGTVQFYVNGLAVGSGVPLVNGVATTTLGHNDGLVSGSREVDAFFSGSANFGPSSNVLFQQVDADDTTLTVTNSPSTSASGAPVTFDFTVTSASGVTPVGAVYLYIDGQVIDAASVDGTGHATLVESGILPGTHTVDASFSGDNGDFGDSTANAPAGQTVAAGFTSTAVTSSPNPSDLNAPATFTATVSPVAPATGVPTGTVEFFDGTTSLGAPVTIDGNGVGTLTVSTLSGGPHSVTAHFVSSDPGTFGDSTSPAHTHTVNRAPTAASLAANPTSSVHGQSVTLTSTVTSFAGSPTGTVEFFDGTTSLGSAPLVTGSASISTSALTTATHSLTAVYSGDGNFLPVTSSVLPLQVSGATSATVVTPSVNPSVFGQPVTFSAAVTAVAPGAGVPTGSVQFFVDGVPSGAAVVLDGTGNATSAPVSNMSVGAHSIDAHYSGDVDFLLSSANVLTSVNQGSTTTSVASDPNPSVFGQSVTITATVAPVAPAAGIPAGSVEFFDGATSLGTGNLSSGVATLTTSASSVGHHALTAVYSGETRFTTSTSSAIDQVVTTGATATTVVSSQNPSVFSGAVTFTATVAAVAPATGTPTGTAQLFDGATALGAPVALSGGSASFNVAGLTGGSHAITVQFVSADPNTFANSTSGVLTQVVDAAGTATNLSASPTSPVHGQAVTFTAAVVSYAVLASGVVPTGTVQFTIDGTDFGPAVTLDGSGQATSGPTSALTTGSHSITAVYSADANYSASTSDALSLQVSTSVSATVVSTSVNPSVFGQPVTFSGAVSAVTPGAGTPTGTVQFLVDGVTSGGPVAVNAFGVATSDPVASLSVGDHTITAEYSGDADFQPSTGAASQTVGQGASATALTSAPNPSLFGQSVTATATVTAVGNAAGTPAGSVEFFDGATSLGTGNLSSGVATLTTSTLSVGHHALTAVYSGDTNFTTSTSSSTDQLVDTAATTTAVVSSQNPSTFSNPVTFTATVAPVAPATGTPAGSVEFFDGTISLGTPVALSGGSAAVNASLAGGSHAITAKFVSADANTFANSTSDALTQVVDTAGTATDLSASPTSPVHGQPVTFTAAVSSFAALASGVVPTGTIQFNIDGTDVGSAVPVDATGHASSVPSSSLSTGSHTITATYSGDSNYTTSVSSPLTLQVGSAVSATVVTTSANPSVFGQGITFSANVTAVAPGAGVPTGTVQFFVDSIPVGTPVAVDGSGTATSIAVSNLSVDDHSVDAIYSGDADFLPSSANVIQTVTKGSSSISVTSDPNPSLFGQSVTVTATVAPVAPAAGTPTGAVEFFDGTTSLGTGNLSAGVATISTAALAVGSHPLTAVYAGDPNFTTSTAPVADHVVNTAATTTVVVSSQNPSTFSNSVTFTATVAPVAPATGTPAGTVEFFDGTTSLGTPITLAGGTASQNVSTLSGGAHPITAKFVSADANTFSNSTSDPLDQVVTTAGTATDLSASPTSPVHGQPVTFTATVASFAATASGVIPTGTIQFSIDGSSFGTPVALNALGQATSDATSTLTTTGHTVTAVYSGDGNYTTSTSSDLSLQVSDAVSATVVSASVNPSVFGQGVTFSATVAAVAPGAGTPTGTVQFSIDSVLVGGPVTLVNGGATSDAVSSLSVGAHTVTASYSGDVDFLSSLGTVTQNVGQGSSSTALSSAPTPSRFGQSVTATATVTAAGDAAGTPSGSVEFFDNGTSLGTGTLAAGVATITTSTLAVGTHPLTAVYAGDTNFTTSTSAVADQVVDTAATTTAVVSSQSPSTFSNSVTFTATVAPVAPATGTPAGTVEFFDGTTSLGAPVTLTGGSAGLDVSSLSGGSHSITVKFVSADANTFSNSTSDALTQVVNTADTDTGLTASPTSPVHGQAVTFTATVSSFAATASGVVPTGTVQFRIDGADSGTPVALDGAGQATSAAVSTLSTTNHTVTAVYAGDGNYTTSTSGDLGLQVSDAASATQVTTSVNPSVFGQGVSFTASVTAVAPGAGTPTGSVQFWVDGVTSGGPVPVNAFGVATSDSLTNLSVGDHSIDAVYAGDVDFLPSSANVIQHVIQGSTTTSLASDPNPSLFGQTVTLTATVAPVDPAAGVASASVEFFDGATSLGTGTLASGVATVSTSGLSVGTHALTAVYAGDGNFTTSTSAGVDQVVDTAGTTTAVVSSQSPSTFSNSVTFTATVSPLAPATGTPAGTVEFFDGTTSLGAPVTLTGGSAGLDVSSLTGGSHPITAKFVSADAATFGDSTSDPLTQSVNTADTDTGLAASPTSPVHGQSVTFTANVVSFATTSGVVPTGTVQFKVDGTDLGTPVALDGTGHATSVATSALPTGGHTVTAAYAGDSNYTPSTSGDLSLQVSEAVSATVVSASVNPSVFGQGVTFSATVTAVAPGVGTPTGTVQFFVDGVTSGAPLTLDGSGTATGAALSNLSVGDHSIQAVYSGDVDFMPSSENLVQHVTQGSSATAVSSSPNPSVVGQSVTVTATVTASGDAAGTPTGSVEFFDNGTSIGTGTLSSGVASIATSALAVGTHPLTAVYAGDTNFTTSTSSVGSQVVTGGLTTTSVTSSLPTSVFGQTVTFTATVAPIAPATGTPAGSVTFLDGAAPLGTSALDGAGVATLDVSTLTGGDHSITAQFTSAAPDTFGDSTSSAITQTVNQALTAVTLDANPTSPVHGEGVTLTAGVVSSQGSPTGSVTFLDGATPLGTANLVAGSASITTSSLSTGTHPLTAQYSGDTNFLSNTSAVASLQVSSATSATVVTTSATPSVSGQGVDFSATVTAVAPGAGTPTGSVQFSVDGTPSGGPVTVDGSGHASSATLTDLTVGDHTITASYSGDTDFLSSIAQVTQTVGQASSATALSSDPNPSVLGQTVTLTATVSIPAPGAGSPAGSVQFFDGTNPLGTGTVNAGVATISVSGLTVGTHSLTAVYSGETRFSGSTSAVTSQVVSAGLTSTSLSSSANPSAFASPVTFTATVTPVAPAVGTPAGTVEFFDGTTSLGAPVAIDGAGIGALTLSTLTGGAHSITANFVSSDAGTFGNSTSAALTQTVDKALPVVTLDANPTSAVHGQPVTLTASVLIFGATPTGTVTFLDGATPLGTATLVSGSASITTSALLTGSNALTAAYSGDGNLSPATSAVATLNVGKAQTATTLAAPPSPSLSGQGVSFSATVTAVVPGAGVPAGAVQFNDGANPLGSPIPLDGSGVATSATFTNLGVGTHSITAIYSGNPDFSGSTSGAGSQVVNQAASQTGLVSSVNPSANGQSVTFTATVTVTAPGVGPATGDVQFLDGTTPIGSGTLDGSGIATFSTAGLSGGTHPITAVYAGDAGNTGSTSDVVSQVVGGASQSITFGVLGNKSYGDTPFTVSATASSGLPVSFGSNTAPVCTVAGSTVTIVSVGQCTIEASQAGDASFGPAAPVDQSFTVVPASQTITFGPLGNKSYGDAPFTVSATATSGLPVSFTSPTPAVCTVTGSTVSIVGVGTCTVEASQAGDANRGPATPVDQSFTVAKAPLTITVQPAAKTYGQANPAFVLGYATFVNGDTAGSLSGTAVYATAATTSSAAGTYPVSVSGLTSSKYTITFVAGQLTVGKASLTVTPASQSKVFGQADPAFTFAYGTFQNGDVAGVVDTAPTCTVAGAHAAAGSYSITCSGGADDNYTFAFSTATLTVATAATTVAILSDTPDPSVTGQSYAVAWSVAVTAPGAGTPTGTVSVSDGTTQCSAAVAAGTCSLASGTAGNKTLTATYSGDANFQSSVSSGAAHNVNNGAVPLSISTLTPNAAGRGAVSKSIVVAGGGFLSGATAAISGTGVTVNSVTWNSSSQLTLVVSVATGATLGARNLTVTNPGNASVTATGAFTVTARPTANAADPDQAPQGSPAYLSTVTGSGFVAGATVVISGTGVTVNSATASSSTKLSISLAVSPTAPLGWRSITVTNPDGGVGTCDDCIRIVAAAAAPTVTSVTPGSAVQGAANQAIVINGTNFAAGFADNGGTVSFGPGVTVSSVTRNSATKLTAQVTVAANATVGSRDVTVTNPGGIGATLTNGFSVAAAPVVTISSVTPASAIQGSANKVIVISGSNFAAGFVNNGGTVSFGAGITVNSVTRNSANQLTARITVAANAAIGSRNVKVTNPDGTSATSVGAFSVAGAPTITSVSPNSANRGSNNLQVTINGTNFASGVTATISGNGITVNSVNRLSATQVRLSVTIAGNANRNSRNVSVINPDGGIALRSGGFTVN